MRLYQVPSYASIATDKKDEIGNDITYLPICGLNNSRIKPCNRYLQSAGIVFAHIYFLYFTQYVKSRVKSLH